MQILYQDQYLIAINKPAGLLSHRSKIDKFETRFAMQMLRDIIGRHVFLIHRLDKPASGVMLFALDKDTATKMSQLFFNRGVTKHYLAICRGFLEKEGSIDYGLQEQIDKMTDSKADQSKIAQPAITNFRKLAQIEIPVAVGRYQTSRYSLVVAQPITGRKHQIRRHMKHIFHPIVGDTTHGDGKHNSLFRDLYNCKRLLLHSSQLSFTHPYSNQAMSINAPLEEDFKNIIEAFGWGDSICTENYQ